MYSVILIVFLISLTKNKCVVFLRRENIQFIGIGIIYITNETFTLKKVMSNLVFYNDLTRIIILLILLR